MLSGKILRATVWIFILFLRTICVGWHTNNEIAIVFFDVGQGDAAVVETPGGRRVLIDGGPDDCILTEFSIFSSYFDDKIDYIIVSHTDTDHFAGVYEIVEYYRFKVCYINLQKDRLSLGWKKPADAFVAGNSFVLDDVKFEVLWPDALTLSSNEESNNKSIVLKVSYKDLCAIFAGDIEEEIEGKLVDLYKEKIDCEILKVPHHGSSTSSSDRFVKAVSPKLAVISVGKGNKYGHPSPKVLERYIDVGAVLWRTDVSGRLIVKYDGGNIKY